MAPTSGVVERMKWEMKCSLSLPFNCNRTSCLWAMTDEDVGEGGQAAGRRGMGAGGQVCFLECSDPGTSLEGAWGFGADCSGPAIWELGIQERTLP